MHGPLLKWPQTYVPNFASILPCLCLPNPEVSWQDQLECTALETILTFPYLCCRMLIWFPGVTIFQLTKYTHNQVHNHHASVGLTQAYPKSLFLHAVPRVWICFQWMSSLWCAHLLQSMQVAFALTEMFVWLEVHISMRVEWRCASMTNGGQCVMTSGTTLMLLWSANSWGMHTLEVSTFMCDWWVL